MSFEDVIRQIIREENQKHLNDIKQLLESHGYQEAPKMLKPKEAAKILDKGVTATYDLCHHAERNGFPVIRDGERFKIPYHALMNWIDEQTKQVI